MNNRLTEAYISILKEELLMATGCTEPIAIAYCAAKMRDILGGEPGAHRGRGKRQHT